jgi:hypothetical protein
VSTTAPDNRGHFISNDPRARQWRPGQSGNPGGRPQSFTALIRESTQDGAEIVQFVLTVFRNGSVRQRQWAADWLADRGFGRPIQMIGLMSTEEFTEAIQTITEVLKAVVHREIRDPVVADRLLQAMRTALDLVADGHEPAAVDTTAGGSVVVLPPHEGEPPP